MWIIGDSTVRNGTLGDGSNLNQWGWGAPIVLDFDLGKINVVNRAFGGTSSRSFYTGFFWQNLLAADQKGRFRHRCNSEPTTTAAPGKGALQGVGAETQEECGEPRFTPSAGICSSS